MIRNNKKEVIELHERNQMSQKKKMNKIHKQRLKEQYEDRIKEKQKCVKENNIAIHKLAEKEKIALYTLKDTLNLEHNFDIGTKYDLKG
mmetsp:Transcript_17119/g.15088  ORF Transcript_17119/g.15088 Transcript_17119/m.15088 type:complete len:89 (+) Transcript_17119:376-642(+)